VYYYSDHKRVPVCAGLYKDEAQLNSRNGLTTHGRLSQL